MDEKENKIEDKATEELTAATNELTAEIEAEEAKIDEQMSAEMDKVLNTPVTPAEPEPAEAVPTEPAPVAPTETTAQAAPAEKPKKSKKGLIIGGAIAGALVLVGGGIGVAYAMMNTPENIALSAISDFLSTTEHSVNGTFSVEMKKENAAFPLEGATVSLKTETNVDGENATTATLNATYDGEDYSISLGSVLIKDYTIYASVGGVKDAVATFMKNNVDEDYVDFSTSFYIDLIEQIAEEVDGVWWKISVPDLIDVTDATGAQKTEMKKTYSCVVDALNKAQERNSKYADIYKENAFVNLEKYTGSKSFSGKGTAYAVSIDADKYLSFMNTMIDETDDLGLSDCYQSEDVVTFDEDEECAETDDGTECLPSSSYRYGYEISKLTKEDVETMLKAMPEIVLTINSSFFNHELTGMYMEKTDKNYTGTVELTFGKLTNSIEAPADSKPITDLYETVVEKIEDFEETAECRFIEEEYPMYFEYYCDENYHPIQNYEVQPNVNI